MLQIDLLKILIIGGVSRSLINFREPLIRAMRAKGYEVVACAGEPQADVVKKLDELSVHFVPVCLARKGMNPLEDLRTCWRLYRLISLLKPDVVLAYTVKPVVWGGLAARLAGVSRSYSLITGLGSVFSSENDWRGNIVSFVARVLYRFSLTFSRRVIFQNPDDMEVFKSLLLVRKEQCAVVNGSGVDLDHYGLAPLPLTPRFLMICRLLRDKGVREYVYVARILKKQYQDIKFILAGPLDPNPTSISQSELNDWIKEGVIDYLGVLDDVRPAIADSSIFVLPSYYREGTPRTVLEAMSMGRAVITTDAPGCRETVVDGDNGFLVQVKSVKALETAMRRFIDEPSLIARMGKLSRVIAEKKYDVRKVNTAMLRVMGLE